MADRIVAPARKPHNEIALTPTAGGFGTPPFEFQGKVVQVRLDGAELVVSDDGAERRIRLVSIADAASFVGAGLFFDGVPEDAALEIDREAADRLAELYAFAEGALETLRASAALADEPSEIVLWPEHFDIAFDAGADDDGGRATYGVSPGDELHPQPYLYVLPWREHRRSEIWNATGFAGAELPYADLVGADDPGAVAAEFFEGRREALAH